MEGYYEDTFGLIFQDHDNMDFSDSGRKRSYGDNYADKHKHTFTLPFKKYGANGKPKGFETVDCYSTPYSNSKIRDAISGEYTKYTVGKKEESLFFKVVNATGSCRDGPIHLYYFSPDQYEQHNKCVVDEHVKTRWQKTYNETCDALGL
jgi:hypothetical protein